MQSFRLVFIFLLSLLNPNDSKPQSTKSITPLFSFLQHNCDSTIVYFPNSPWVHYPNYSIVSKCEGNVFYSTYKNPYVKYSIMYEVPKSKISEKFIREERIFEKEIPDTNQYFLPKAVHYSMRNKYWNDMISLMPWDLDDKFEGECSDSCDVYDAGSISLYLITKSSIKVLAFYAPAYFEQCCPGNENRRKVLRIEDIFTEAFQK